MNSIFEVLIYQVYKYTCSNSLFEVSNLFEQNVEISIIFRKTFLKYRYLYINYAEHFDRAVPLGK